MTIKVLSAAKTSVSNISNQQLFNPGVNAQSSLIAQKIPQTIGNKALKVAPSIERQFTNAVIKQGFNAAPVAVDTAEKSIAINIIKGAGKFTKAIPFIGALVEIGTELVFPASTAKEPDMRSDVKPNIKPLPISVDNPAIGETGGYKKFIPGTVKSSSTKNKVDLNEALKIFNKGLTPIHVGKNESIKEISKRTGISAKEILEEWKKGGTVQDAIDRVLQNRRNNRLIQSIKLAAPSETIQMYDKLTAEEKAKLPQPIKDAINKQKIELEAAKKAKEIYKGDKYEVAENFKQLSEKQKNALNPQVMQAYYDKITRGLTSFQNQPYPTHWWAR